MNQSRKVSVWLPYCGAGTTHFLGTLAEVKAEISRRAPEFWALDIAKIDALAATTSETDYRAWDIHTGLPVESAQFQIQFLPPDYPKTRAKPNGRTYRLLKPGTIQYTDTLEISVSF